MVSAGELHTAILKTDGTLWMCGYNNYGQLGDGTNTDKNKPVKVMSGVKTVSAGGIHTAIVKTDGTLWMCGYNRHGELGDGTCTDKNKPVKVMTGVKSVSAGGYHTAIVKTDDTLWMCGYNYYGQLGDGTYGSTNKPVKVMSGVESVSAGDRHTAIVKTDGTLWMCGYNWHGQLGDGTNTSRNTPVKIMSGVKSVSAGEAHTAIVKTDGTLWMCGHNWCGELGDGTNTEKDKPVKVRSSVKSVSAGGSCTAILKIDDTLWMCGLNGSGQLGDGTDTERNKPVKVRSGIKSVSAGWAHTAIVKTDGTLWMCGLDDHGQLGDGTNTNKNKPVKITLPQSTILLSSATVSGINSAYAYTGKEIKPVPVLKINNQTLVSGTDYIVKYKNNKKLGTATITITGKGRYTGQKVIQFTIMNKDEKELSDKIDKAVKKFDNRDSTMQKYGKAIFELTSKTYTQAEEKYLSALSEKIKSVLASNLPASAEKAMTKVFTDTIMEKLIVKPSSYNSCKTAPQLVKKVAEDIVNSKGSFSFTDKGITYTANFKSIGVSGATYIEGSINNNYGGTYSFMGTVIVEQNIEEEMTNLKAFAQTKIDEAKKAVMDEVKKIVIPANLKNYLKSTLKTKALKALNNVSPNLSVKIKKAIDIVEKYITLEKAYKGLKSINLKNTKSDKVLNTIKDYNKKIDAFDKAVSAFVNI